MEFTQIMDKLLRILEMLDKIYHAIVKEEPTNGGAGVCDTEQE